MKKNDMKFSILWSLILILSSIIFELILVKLNILPTKYMLVVLGILVFINLMMIFFQFFPRINKFNLYFSRVICSIISCALLFVSYKITTGDSLLSGINREYRTDVLSVIVLRESKMYSLDDTADKVYGIQSVKDISNTKHALDEINGKLNTEVKTKRYEEISDQIDALYNKECDVIIMNEAFREVLKETYTDLDTKTKVLYTVEIKVPYGDISKNVDVTEEPFNILISGIDIEGDVSTRSRSDVNIILTINPKTKQILMTSTPRDYHVPLATQNDEMDKLSHAGLYGVECSVKTLENLYDTNINYYVRLNFTSFVKIIDTLGGVNVYSDYSFSSGGYQFVKGYQHMDGKKALVFSRTRKVFSEGDRQRGRDQQHVIEGVIRKIASPAILNNYEEVLSNLSDSFETNMTVDELKSLIKMQLNDMSDWNIVSNSVNGSNSSAIVYTMRKGRPQYVMIPDMQTVEHAKELMAQVAKGEIVQINQ